MCYLRLFIFVLQELPCTLQFIIVACSLKNVYIKFRLDWMLCE